MTIFIRGCGHSDDTASIHNRTNPDTCFYCNYVIKHPRVEKAPKSDIQMASLYAVNSLRKRNIAKS